MSNPQLLQSDIVSSNLDADKFDYLRRDSHHLGVLYGEFDLHRVLHTLAKTSNGLRICIDIKGKDSLESYRLTRFLMHVQVYEHHARLSADQMFIKALDIAINEENIIDKNSLKFSPMGNNEKFLDFYKSLNDHSIYDMIINSKKAKKSKQLLQNIRNRKLLKRVCEFGPKNLNNENIKNELVKMNHNDLEQMSNDVSNTLGIESHDVIFYKSDIKNKLYKKGAISVKDGNNTKSYESFSVIKGDDESKYLVFGPNDKIIKQKILDKISDRLYLDQKQIKCFS